MAHSQQRDFCRRVKARYPAAFAGKLVLDVGALDVNGSNKALFDECLYLGVDIGPGPNVDIVSIAHELALPDATFDTVISTECFEHDRYYAKTLANIMRLLKPGGLLVFSCATEGRPEHGTRRSGAADAPLLVGEWSDYYRNLTEADVRAALAIDEVFSEHSFEVNAASQDLYFAGVKKGASASRTDLSFIDHDKKIQLYVDRGDGFDERQSQLQPLLPGAAGGPISTPREIHFELGGAPPVRALRLDPIDVPAVVEIVRFGLVTDAGEIDLIPELRSNATWREGHTWYFKSADPQLFIEGVSMLTLAGAKALRLGIRYLQTGAVAAALAELAEDRARASRLEADLACSEVKTGAIEAQLAAAQAAQRAHQGELDRTRGALEETRRELARADQRLEDSVQARNRVELELGRAQAELEGALVSASNAQEQAQEQTQQARTETAIARAETATARAAQAKAKSTLFDTRVALKYAQASLKAANAGLSEVQAQLLRTRTGERRLASELDRQRKLLEAVHASYGWKLTAPLRRLRDVVEERVPSLGRQDLVPIHHLEKTGRLPGRWRATGSDPQFWVRMQTETQTGQWVTLSYDFRCDEPVTAQLFVDCGLGYRDAISATFEIEKSGRVAIPLYLPRSCKAVRLDPMNQAGEFSLRNFKVSRSRKKPKGGPEHDRLNEYLQLFDRLGLQLLPEHHLVFEPRARRHWRSTGSDPGFLVEFDGRLDTFEGWHRFELKLESDQKQAIARLYFDTGNGFNEAETLALSYASGEPAARVFHIDRPIHNLRFDPADGPHQFEVLQLRLVAIGEDEAIETMALRLASTHEAYLGKTVGEVVESVATSAKVELREVIGHLKKQYDMTFEVQQSNLDYAAWIEGVEKNTVPTREAAAGRLAGLSRRPVISVVIPVYNTPEAHLRACLDSILAQSYPDWQLCVADDASPRPEVKRVLDEYRARDSRILVVHREHNGHISQASNSALELATGEYVALVDHDDVLSEHALFFVACALDAQPGAQIVYTDEDKLDARGHRCDPHFKSDWNPDLFFSQNYVSHLGVYRRDLLGKIGGFREGVEGSQDQDLLLRCLPHVRDREIVHIPRVLYHWRQADGSTAQASEAKRYTIDAGLKSLRDYFASVGKQVTVEAGVIPNTYRVHYEVPHPAPLVSLLIPTRDMVHLLRACVESILKKTTYPNYEILILDNGSVEPATLEFFEEIRALDPRVKVLSYDFPFNYSAINNFGVDHCRGELIGLINNDIEVIAPDWLTEMVSHACRPEIGCVGAKLYYGNDTLQHGGVIIGLGGVANHSHKHFPKAHPGYFARLVVTQNFSAVTAACAVVRKDVYLEVGGLDEENLKVAFNDVDFCLKVREAGYRNLWTPYAELYHHESVSRGAEDNPEKVARFNGEVAFMMAKWGKALERDPFYSPNLTKDRQDFSI